MSASKKKKKKEVTDNSDIKVELIEPWPLTPSEPRRLYDGEHQGGGEGGGGSIIIICSDVLENDEGFA